MSGAVGLPGDTPEGFVNTLERLKASQSYSVVHPFVLSILPGTDFRLRADELNLQYDPHPPYFVRSTPTFPADEIRLFDTILQRLLQEVLTEWHAGPGSLPAPSQALRADAVFDRFVDLLRECAKRVHDGFTNCRAHDRVQRITVGLRIIPECSLQAFADRLRE